MSFRYRPLGAVMTEDDYMAGAMERPLSPWQTFRGSVADAVLASPGIGTAIREGSTPELARAPVAGGRGGVQWRGKSAAEVAGEGDTLLETPEQFKASPSFRPDIPFEKGMTASRAKALAEMYDTSQVRKFYGSKRPVTAFLGTVAGSALDPINYIPIVGEVAGAAAVARVGRIAGRAAVGSADAAMNTALFATLTASERAKFGDDVSWAAIGTNAAYAALAGAAIGGTIGGVSKFRHWSIDRPQPAVPDVAVPTVKETQGAVDVPKPPDLTISGTATAKSTPVHTASVDSVLSRLETAGQRTKAAEVMNDAIDGLVNTGEVRLGERSQGHIEDMQVKVEGAGRQVAPIVTLPSSQSLATPPAPTVKDMKNARLEAVPLVAVRGTQHKMDMKAFDEGRHPPPLIEGFADKPVAVRKEDGEYLIFDGHHRVVKAINAGEQTLDMHVIAVKSYAPEFAGRKSAPHSMTDDDLLKELGVTSALRTTANYSLPAPDPIPEGLAAATTRIEANVKAKAEPVKQSFTGTSAKIKQPKTGPEAKAEPTPSKTPLTAEMKRMISEANDEGFDPETGQHDLEPEIEMMREQNALTPEEDAALKAADETHEAVGAWEEVMNVARGCVIR